MPTNNERRPAGTERRSEKACQSRTTANASGGVERHPGHIDRTAAAFAAARTHGLDANHTLVLLYIAHRDGAGHGCTVGLDRMRAELPQIGVNKLKVIRTNLVRLGLVRRQKRGRGTVALHFVRTPGGSDEPPRTASTPGDADDSRREHPRGYRPNQKNKNKKPQPAARTADGRMTPEQDRLAREVAYILGQAWDGIDVLAVAAAIVKHPASPHTSIARELVADARAKKLVARYPVAVYAKRLETDDPRKRRTPPPVKRKPARDPDESLRRCGLL